MAVQIVFHVDEPEKWEMVLGNLRNTVRAVDMASSHVEVVANSGAVRQYLTDTPEPAAAEMRRLADAGVRFTACRNALAGLGIHSEQLLPFVEVVPSAVLELARRQSEGYAYIRP